MITVWYTPPKLLIVKPFRCLPQRHQLSPRHPHIARGDLGDIRRRDFHAGKSHTLG